METTKAKEIIDNFLKEKSEKHIITENKKILSNAKKGKHERDIETIIKREDAIEYNQWVKNKLDKLTCLFGNTGEPVADLLNCLMQIKNIYEEKTDQIELKEVLSKELANLKKVLKKEIQLADLKLACDDILGGKIKTDNDNKARRILAILAESHPDIAEKIQTIEQHAQEKFEGNQWLSDAAAKAGGVVIDVTHIAKLTHSSAKGSNVKVRISKSNSEKPILVTTNCASELPMDFAYSTAEYAPVAEFLQLDCKGKLFGKLICENPSILKDFAKDETQLKHWQGKFMEAFYEKEKSTHTLLKQVYFPVDSHYHLVAPLVSSSMAQIIYDRIWLTRQEKMVARDARNKDLFSDQIDVLFHKTAVLKTTQTNPQNVSNLNGKRRGQLILIPAVPPKWKKQNKPPIKIKTIFNRELGYQAKEPLEKLRKLLLAIKFNELSVNLQRKQIITELITEAADVLFDHVTQIHELKNNAGWSLESRLPIHQQYWLDPFRTDEGWQASRADVGWQEDISKDFSKWVNRQLRHPKLTLGVAHGKHWKKIFVPLLREFNAIVDASLNEPATTGEEKA